MTPPPSLTEPALADIEFVLSECMRLHQLVERIGLKEAIKTLSKDDLASLPLPNGGHIFCGAEALRRIHRMATRALRESDLAATVEAERVFHALEHLIPQKFAERKTVGTSEEIEEILAAALNEAKHARCDRTHFIPCRLMRANDPPTFSIGPVRFHTLESFDESMKARYAAYIESASSPQQRDLREKLLGDGRHYYGGFGWVAEVKILSCDPATSEQRARVAVTAALDVLHLLFGAGHLISGGLRTALRSGPRFPFAIRSGGRRTLLAFNQAYRKSATWCPRVV